MRKLLRVLVARTCEAISPLLHRFHSRSLYLCGVLIYWDRKASVFEINLWECYVKYLYIGKWSQS